MHQEAEHEEGHDETALAAVGGIGNHVELGVIIPGPVLAGGCVKSRSRDAKPLASEDAGLGMRRRPVAPPMQRKPSPKGVGVLKSEL